MPSRLFLLSLLLLLAGCSLNPSPDLATVERVDLARYAGKWHEIARYPNRFQEGCADSTAEYGLLPGGDVRVVNECVRDGTTARVEGTAKVVDAQSNAKLKVTFFWPFYGKYWIVDLGREYDFAAVSEPSRRYLWILARSPSLAPEVLEPLLARLRDKGFDTSRLLWNKAAP